MRLFGGLRSGMFLFLSAVFCVDFGPRTMDPLEQALDVLARRGNAAPPRAGHDRRVRGRPGREVGHPEDENWRHRKRRNENRKEKLATKAFEQLEATTVLLACLCVCRVCAMCCVCRVCAMCCVSRAGSCRQEARPWRRRGDAKKWAISPTRPFSTWRSGARRV